LRSAVDVHLSMATFATAGIVGRAGSSRPPAHDGSRSSLETMHAEKQRDAGS
jgi:hypothetical protein